MPAALVVIEGGGRGAVFMEYAARLTPLPTVENGGPVMFEHLKNGGFREWLAVTHAHLRDAALRAARFSRHQRSRESAPKIGCASIQRPQPMMSRSVFTAHPQERLCNGNGKRVRFPVDGLRIEQVILAVRLSRLSVKPIGDSTEEVMGAPSVAEGPANTDRRFPQYVTLAHVVHRYAPLSRARPFHPFRFAWASR